MQGRSATSAKCCGTSQLCGATCLERCAVKILSPGNAKNGEAWPKLSLCGESFSCTLVKPMKASNMDKLIAKIVNLEQDRVRANTDPAINQRLDAETEHRLRLYAG